MTEIEKVLYTAKTIPLVAGKAAFPVALMAA
jgi:hypothetical protein